MLTKYKVINYKVVPDPKLPQFSIFSSYYVTIGETTFSLNVLKRFRVVKEGMFWVHTDTGEFISIAVDRVLRAYELKRRMESK